MDFDLTFDSGNDLYMDFTDLDAKFASIEETLDAICDKMEDFLMKISVAERQLNAACGAKKSKTIVFMYQRIKLLKTMYNFYYQLAEQKSQQLISVDRQRPNSKAENILVL
jgi:hypothetical protein